MRKHYLLLLSSAVVTWLSASAVTVPYSSPLIDAEKEAVVDDWTIVNNNHDGKTWAYEPAGKNNDLPCLYYCYTSNDADDWAISPGFELSAGKEYAISYILKEYKALGKGTEIVKVFIGTSHEVSELAGSTLLKEHNKDMGNVWKFHKQRFTPEQDGTYYIAFQACSPKNQWYIYLRDFAIKEYALTPSPVTELAIVPGENNELSATLTWTLPETDDDGNVLETPISSIKVKRNGETIATLTGTSTEYVDNDLPCGGKYTYSVIADINGSESLATSATSQWIGPKATQDLPYSENFTDEEMFNIQWEFIDVDGDLTKTDRYNPIPPYKNGWCLHSQNTTTFWPIMYTPAGSETNENDWLVSAPLKFPAAGKYKVSFKLSRYSTGSETCLLDVYVGTEESAEAMSQHIATITQLTSTELNPKNGALHEYEFEVAEEGTYFIGFWSHLAAEGNNAKDRRTSLGAFKVEVVELYDDPITVLVPPFDSATAEGWNPATSLTFALEKGYYHASYATDGTATFASENAAADTEFSNDFTVVKSTAPCEATFSADAPFSAFAIAPANHTPASADECSYITDADGTKTFKFTCPSLNTSGNALYEIESAKLLADGIQVAETADCTPGTESTIQLPAEQLRAAEPEYTIVLHNLSGNSEPTVFENATVGIESVAIDGDDATVRLFMLNGTEVSPSSKLPAGLYIELCGNRARKITVK